jgi:hypothetical protein
LADSRSLGDGFQRPLSGKQAYVFNLPGTENNPEATAILKFAVETG